MISRNILSLNASPTSRQSMVLNVDRQNIAVMDINEYMKYIYFLLKRRRARVDRARASASASGVKEVESTHPFAQLSVIRSLAITSLDVCGTRLSECWSKCTRSRYN